MPQAGIMLATQLQNKPSKTLKMAQTHPRHMQHVWPLLSSNALILRAAQRLFVSLGKAGCVL